MHPRTKRQIGGCQGGVRGNLSIGKSMLIYISSSIVAIHGLGGYRIRTWTMCQRDNNSTTCWLADLLPTALGIKVPIRVLTFGYSAGSFRGRLDLSIGDAATQLLTE